MESRKYLIISLVIGSALAPGVAFGYERETHSQLTKATIQAFEKVRGNAFSNSEELQIIKGSQSEDDGTRPLQHFYDPINNRGLTEWGKEWESSKYWAQDTEAQGNYCDYIFCSTRISYYDKFFSSPTDFSWDRAVYEYAWGDQMRGLETLGHILHFVQDASVPAHVRNDQHLNHEGFGDIDPLETYASQHDKNLSAVKVQIPFYPGIAFAIDSIANFTNTHFLSKNTLFRNYDLPNLGKLDIRNNFAYDPEINIKIARVEERDDFFRPQQIQKTYIDDDLNSIAKDYWTTLSLKSIETGAGVIDLFFRKVEEEKKTLALKQKNTSAAERESKKLALEGFDVVKALYGSSLTKSDVEDLLNSGQAGAASLAVADTSEQEIVQKTVQETDTVYQEETSTSKDMEEGPSTVPTVPQTPNLIEDDIGDSEPGPEESESQIEQTPSGDDSNEAEKDSDESLDNSSGGPSYTPSNTGSPTQSNDSGGGSPIDQEEQTEESIATTTPLVLSIISPSDGAIFATTSVPVTGTTTPGAIVSATSGTSTATTTASESGEWSFAFELESGTTTLSLIASSTDATSTPETLSVFVDLLPPDTPALTIPECDYSLSDEFCFVPADTVSARWSSVPGATAYSIVVDGVASSTGAATSSFVTLSADATTSIAVVAHDSAGRAATSSELEIYYMEQPLVINEIGWMGTASHAEDEWLEVKNVSPYTLTLNAVRIVSADGSPEIPLEGSVTPYMPFNPEVPDNFPPNDGYYLIERTDDTTTDAPASLVAPFSGEGPSGLSNDGEELLLQWYTGISTTTMDRTPAVSTCGGWCAGAVNAEIGSTFSGNTSTAPLSMERIEGTADGSLAANWRDNDTYISGLARGSEDAEGIDIYGTPGVDNGKGWPDAGWFCSPDETPITDDVHYQPTSQQCTYLSRFINVSTSRNGAVFEGVPGASKRRSEHLLGKGVRATTVADGVPEGTAPGTPFFILIYENTGRLSNVQKENLITYFETGTSTLPNMLYRTIPWVYGP